MEVLLGAIFTHSLYLARAGEQWKATVSFPLACALFTLQQAGAILAFSASLTPAVPSFVFLL